MRKQFMLAMLLVLAVASTTFAGPFGIFGKGRHQATASGNCSNGNCSNGNCSSSTTQSSFSSTSSYNMAAPVVRAVPQVTTILQTGPAVLTGKPSSLPLTVGGPMPELPAKLTINGIEYLRH
jgi:hypothetical protein